MSAYVFVYQALNPDVVLRMSDRQAKALTRGGMWARVTPAAVRKSCTHVMERTGMSIRDMHEGFEADCARMRPSEQIDYQHAWQFLSAASTRIGPKSILNNLDVVIASTARLSGSTYVSIIEGTPRRRETHMYCVTLMIPYVGEEQVYVWATTATEATGYASRRLIERAPPTDLDIDLWFGDDDQRAPTQCYGVWSYELVPQPDSDQINKAERAWQL